MERLLALRRIYDGVLPHGSALVDVWRRGNARADMDALVVPTEDCAPSTIECRDSEDAKLLGDECADCGPSGKESMSAMGHLRTEVQTRSDVITARGIAVMYSTAYFFRLILEFFLYPPLSFGRKWKFFYVIGKLMFSYLWRGGGGGSVYKRGLFYLYAFLQSNNRELCLLRFRPACVDFIFPRPPD